MKITKSKEFIGEKAWDSLKLAEIDNVTVKLHWTDKAYIWHTNDGSEVFVVLDGIVNMFYKKDSKERVVQLLAGDIFYAESGDEHKAEPKGVARVLVVERAGSI